MHNKTTAVVLENKSPYRNNNKDGTGGISYQGKGGFQLERPHSNFLVYSKMSAYLCIDFC